MGFFEDNKNKLIGAAAVVIVVVVVLFIWKPWGESFSPKQLWHTSRRREGVDSPGDPALAEVAEIAPVGTTQLDGDIPSHLATVNDPNFMTTPSVVLSTTSRIGENLKYRNITTDLRGSVPRVYGGSGSPFNQNLQDASSNINPDTY
jgi:hypothetical protein